MSADTIVNVAQGAWKVIKDGQPSSEISTATANAVPEVDDWRSLSGARGPGSIGMRWKKPVAWPFEGYVFVQFEIQLKWDYGATYKGGGAYIPNIWVEVPHCYAGWSWDVDIGITVRNPTNYGSEEAPIARVPVTVSGSVDTYEHSYHVDWGFVVYGTGHWENS